MKRRKWIFCGIFFLCMIFVCKLPSNAASFVAIHGRLSVKGTKIVDSSGKTVQLKGVSTHGLAWYPEYVSKEAFKSLRDQWGANTVRLAMYTAEYNGYCTGSAANKKQLKAVIDKGVKAATDLGMYVIIDWHILSDGNPNRYKSQSISFFKEMAKKYKSKKNVIYEICNEPNGGTSWSQVKSYATSVIKEIRAIDKNAIIIVGTPTWSQDVDQAAKSKITGYKNIMYSFHFYANTHKAAMRSKLEAALKKGLPVFVTEFGISEASGNGSVSTYQGDQWIKLLNSYKVGYICWNFSNKNESSALIRSSCKKLSNWKETDLTASGKWIVKKMAGSLSKLPKTTTTAKATTTTKATTAKATTTTAQPAVTDTLKKVTAKATLVNSWKSGSKYYYQYVVSITNSNASQVKNWKLKGTWKYNLAIDQSWNAKFSKSTNTLTISPVSGSWNEKINAKQTVTDIGFILSSTTANTLKKMEVISVK